MCSPVISAAGVIVDKRRPYILVASQFALQAEAQTQSTGYRLRFPRKLKRFDQVKDILERPSFAYHPSANKDALTVIDSPREGDVNIALLRLPRSAGTPEQLASGLEDSIDFASSPPGGRRPTSVHYDRIATVRPRATTSPYEEWFDLRSPGAIRNEITVDTFDSTRVWNMTVVKKKEPGANSELTYPHEFGPISRYDFGGPWYEDGEPCEDAEAKARVLGVTSEVKTYRMGDARKLLRRAIVIAELEAELRNTPAPAFALWTIQQLRDYPEDIDDDDYAVGVAATRLDRSARFTGLSPEAWLSAMMTTDPLLN